MEPNERHAVISDSAKQFFRSENERLHGILANKEAVIAALKNEVNSNNEMIQALKKENDNFHNLLAQNRSESLSLARDLVQYRNQLVESKEKMSSLSQANDKLVWLLDSKDKKISELNSIIKRLENELKNTLFGKTSAEIEKYSHLSNTIEKLQAERDSFERELIESETRIDSVKSLALCLKSTIENDLLQLALQLKELDGGEQHLVGIRTIHVLSDFYKVNNRFLELSTVEQKDSIA